MYETQNYYDCSPVQYTGDTDDDDDEDDTANNGRYHPRQVNESH